MHEVWRLIETESGEAAVEHLTAPRFIIPILENPWQSQPNGQWKAGWQWKWIDPQPEIHPVQMNRMVMDWDTEAWAFFLSAIKIVRVPLYLRIKMDLVAYICGALAVIAGAFIAYFSFGPFQNRFAVIWSVCALICSVVIGWASWTHEREAKKERDKLKEAAAPPKDPFRISPHNLPANYQVGYKVGGIEWKANYIPCKVIIETRGREIRNLDMKVMLDGGITGIAHIGQVIGFDGMQARPTGELGSGTNKVIVGGTITLYGVDVQGKEVTQVVEQDQRPGAVISSAWRLHFARLLPDSRTEIIIAGFRLEPRGLPPGKITRFQYMGNYEVTKDDGTPYKGHFEGRERLMEWPPKP